MSNEASTEKQPCPSGPSTRLPVAGSESRRPKGVPDRANPSESEHFLGVVDAESGEVLTGAEAEAAIRALFNGDVTSDRFRFDVILRRDRQV